MTRLLSRFLSRLLARGVRRERGIVAFHPDHHASVATVRQTELLPHLGTWGSFLLNLNFSEITYISRNFRASYLRFLRLHVGNWRAAGRHHQQGRRHSLRTGVSIIGVVYWVLFVFHVCRRVFFGFFGTGLKQISVSCPQEVATSASAVHDFPNHDFVNAWSSPASR